MQISFKRLRWLGSLSKGRESLARQAAISREKRRMQKIAFSLERRVEDLAPGDAAHRGESRKVDVERHVMH